MRAHCSCDSARPISVACGDATPAPCEVTDARRSRPTRPSNVSAAGAIGSFYRRQPQPADRRGPPDVHRRQARCRRSPIPICAGTRRRSCGTSTSRPARARSFSAPGHADDPPRDEPRSRSVDDRRRARRSSRAPMPRAWDHLNTETPSVAYNPDAPADHRYLLLYSGARADVPVPELHVPRLRDRRGVLRRRQDVHARVAPPNRRTARTASC